MIAVLEYLRIGGSVWAAVTYFALWAVRLAGFLPDLRVSTESANRRRNARDAHSQPHPALDQGNRHRPAPPS